MPGSRTASTEAMPASDGVHPGRIERSKTGLRILLTILMGLIRAVLETLLGIAVLFSLLWTLITRTPPPFRVRHLCNRAIAYFYEVWRYMTYSQSRVPFPFSEFPEPLDPLEELGGDEAREVCELLGRPGSESRSEEP